MVTVVLKVHAVKHKIWLSVNQTIIVKSMSKFMSHYHSQSSILHWPVHITLAQEVESYKQ